MVTRRTTIIHQYVFFATERCIFLYQGKRLCILKVESLSCAQSRNIIMIAEKQGILFFKINSIKLYNQAYNGYVFHNNNQFKFLNLE